MEDSDNSSSLSHPPASCWPERGCCQCVMRLGKESLFNLQWIRLPGLPLIPRMADPWAARAMYYMCLQPGAQAGQPKRQAQ